MKLAHVEENGRLLGWYHPDLDSNIPTPNIQVTDEEWERSYKNNHNYVSPDGITSYVDLRTKEEVERDVRRMRDLELKIKVDPIAGNALRWASLDVETQEAWATYRQALLDITDQAGFPHDVTWPEEPTT